MFVHLKNGERLVYQKIGTGKRNLVMIHGNICAGLHFKPILPFLQKEYTIYIPDMRGFGESSYFSPIVAVKDLSDDVYDFIMQLNIGRFALLGWSAGGCVSMQYAIDHPQGLQALFLIESVGYKGCPILDTHGRAYQALEEMRLEKTQIAPVLKAIEGQDIAFMKDLWDEAIFVNAKPSTEDAEQYARASLKQRNLLEFYLALCKFNISSGHNGYAEGNGHISSIKVPTLLTWGEKDQIVTKEEVLETAAAIPAAESVLLLKGSGHAPIIDCPAYLAEKMERFLIENL